MGDYHFLSRVADHESFENYLSSEESEAEQHFEAAVHGIRWPPLSPWFERLQENEFIPSLNRLGFSTPFLRSIFNMAATAWESMGPIVEDVLWFFPGATGAIEEVRQGIQKNDEQRFENRFHLSQKNPPEIADMANRSMDPGNLLSVLERVSTPWIILPRVRDHMKMCDSIYLLGYLKYLSGDCPPGLKRILARVIIEFIGNYTLKYLDPNRSKDKMAEALFYAYSAMFWKTLRQPPSGFEPVGVHDFFLNWAHRLSTGRGWYSKDMSRCIERMISAKSVVLPPLDVFGFTNQTCDDNCQFLISLRHGFPGIQFVLKCYGVGSPLIPHKTDGHIPYTAVPRSLSGLLSKIRKHFAREARSTQGFVREFLSALQAVYDRGNIRRCSGSDAFSNQLRFVGARVHRMVANLMVVIN